MSKSEKLKYDEKAYCRFNALILILISFCIMLMPIGIHFEMSWLTYGSMLLIFVVAIGSSIYANTGNRFRNNANSEVPTNDGDSKTNKI